MTKDNNIIAKNTILLYLRMLFSMIIALYTSRIILNTLGIDNYGIFGVVGGVVSLFSFLNSSMTASTSRFLTYNLGQKNINELKRTFNTSLLIHAIIALIVVFISETIGLWLFTNKLIIPIERINAAHWIFQLSILSMSINIVQVPYSACIVAHERFDVYAYTDIFNSLFKLAITFVITIYGGDKLILYGILTTCASIGTIVFCCSFCINKFKECSINILNINKKTLAQMLTFSGWDLIGNLSVTARTQGVNILINMFFGVTLNAANSIAGSIQGIVMAFSNNICMAVKPQIVKSYAAKNYQRTNDLITYTTTGIIYLLALVIIPIILEINFILKIWLGIVPQYTQIFCIYTLIFTFFSALAMLIITIPHAANKNKYPSLINGIIYLSVIPCTYFVYKYYHIVWFPFLYNTISMSIGFIFISWLSNKYLAGFTSYFYLKNIILKNLVLIIISYFITYYIQQHLGSESLERFIYVTFISCILVLILGFTIGVDKQTRNFIFKYVKNKLP